MKVWIFTESLQTIIPAPQVIPNPPDEMMVGEGPVEVDIPSHLLGPLQTAKREVRKCLQDVWDYLGVEDFDGLLLKSVQDAMEGE